MRQRWLRWLWPAALRWVRSQLTGTLPSGAGQIVSSSWPQCSWFLWRRGRREVYGWKRSTGFGSVKWINTETKWNHSNNVKVSQSLVCRKLLHYINRPLKSAYPAFSNDIHLHPHCCCPELDWQQKLWASSASQSEKWGEKKGYKNKIQPHTVLEITLWCLLWIQCMHLPSLSVLLILTEAGLRLQEWKSFTLHYYDSKSFR